MGGNALKDSGATRVSNEEYQILKAEVLEILRSNFKGILCVVPESYRNKATHGDIDVIVSCLDVAGNREHILEIFGTDIHVMQSNQGMALLYKGVQVDLIEMPAEDFSSSYNYYSYNDLGNLLGRIFHKFGLKFGHKGLMYIVRDEKSNPIGEIILSKSMHEILDFIGLNYETWLNGFEGLTDIFEFVIGSPYFNKEIYSYENLNAPNRVRNKKRPTYREFLKYLQNRAEDVPAFIFGRDKSVYLGRIFEKFPYGLEEYKQILEVQAMKKTRRQLFHGEMVKEVTGKTGKELGELMAKLRADPKLEELIQTGSGEGIKKLIESYRGEK